MKALEKPPHTGWNSLRKCAGSMLDCLAQKTPEPPAEPHDELYDGDAWFAGLAGRTDSELRRLVSPLFYMFAIPALARTARPERAEDSEELATWSLAKRIAAEVKTQAARRIRLGATPEVLEEGVKGFFEEVGDVVHVYSQAESQVPEASESTEDREHTTHDKEQMAKVYEKAAKFGASLGLSHLL